MRQHNPYQLTNKYGCTVAVGSNSKATFTSWLHISPLEIQNTLTAGLAHSTSSSAANRDANKVYLTDFQRVHKWRNNTQNSALQFTFWLLKPRKALPSFNGAVSGGAAVHGPAIAPAYNRDYVAGCVNSQPTMYVQDFKDASVLTGAVPLGATEQTVTPFMSPTLCSNFKIKKFFVTRSDGKKGHSFTMQPGEECHHVAKFGYRRPLMCSYNKFDMNAENSENMIKWECLKNTPLIFMQLSGTVSHTGGETPSSAIGLGLGNMDYVQELHWKIYAAQQYPTTYGNFMTNVPAMTDPEQVAEVDADDAKEEYT